MAAIASVTFTSVGTATLGAAAFTFSMQQAAAAEQIESSASSETDTAVTVEASGDKKASDDEESEEVEAEEELLEPDSAPAVSVGAYGIAGSSAAGYSQGGAENVGNLDNAPQQQAGAQSVSPSASLPSDDLGFTTNSYADSIAEALADVESPSVPAAIATELELATPAKPTSSESSSSSNGNDTPLASGSFAPMGTSSWFGSLGFNSSAPSFSTMAKPAASPVLLGAAGEEPEPSTGYPNTIITTFDNANQATIGHVTLQNTFASAAGGTVPVGGITSLKANGVDLGVKINGTAGSDATFLSPNTDVRNNPWTMVMTFSGAEVVQSIDGITLSVGLFTADGNWLPGTVSMNGDVTFTATVAAAVGGTGVSYNFTGSLFGGQEGPHHGQGADKFTVNLTGEALNLNAAVTDATITLTLTSTLDHSCYVGLQDIKYKVTTVPYTDNDLFWKGGTGEWNTNSETKNWNIVTEGGSYQLVAFKNGANIYFFQSGVSSLNITEDRLEAGNVFVDHGVDVRLSAVDGALLKAKNVNVLGDITVTDVAINADTLNIEEGSTVTANTTAGRVGVLTPNLYGDGTFVKDGAGTLSLAGDNTKFEGNFVIKGGKLVIPQSETGALGLGVNPDVTLAGEGAELAGTINASGEDIRITSTADGTVSANISAQTENATLTFDTHEGSTLTASGTLAGNIYKDGDGTLKITGNISGDTGEFFIYQGRVEATNSNSLGNVTVHVDASATLALTAEGGGYHIKDLDVTYGGNLEVAYVSKNDATDSKILQLDHMFLHSSSYVDFSQVTLEAPATGSNKYYVAKYTTAGWTEGDSVTAETYTNGLVQFITMSGLKYGGENGLRADNIVSLWIEGSPEGEGRLYLKVDAPQPGFYWNGRDTENPLVWDIETSQNWSTDYGLTNDVVFKNSQHDLGSHAVRSAYFLKPTGETPQTITMTDDQFEVQNLIIGNGVDKTDYKFQAEESATINMDSDRMANLIVHKNATASFDKVYIGMDKHSLLQVEEGAELRVTNAPFSMYSITNAGKVDVSATTLYLEDLLAHVTNAGDFKVIWEDTSWGSTVQLGDIANVGTMTLGATSLKASTFYGETKTIANDGTLIIDADRHEGIDPTGQVALYMPVQGFGDMETKGENATVRLARNGSGDVFAAATKATVAQNSLTAGAATSIFEEAVELTSYTTVKGGSEATFYGGNTIDEDAGAGSFGALTLKDGTEGNETKLSLGGYFFAEEIWEITGYDEEGFPIYEMVGYDEDVHDSTYAAGPVTAGEHTVFTVENGANATIESYNAEATPSGTIVVGAATSQVNEEGDAPAYSDATLTVDGKTNVKELTVRKGTETPDNVTVDLRGAANVGHLTQDGGTVHFREDSFLDTGNVSGGVMSIKPDHVLTLGHVITETGNYTVVNNDGVGIAGYIDASNLKLVTDTTHSTYKEVKYDGETTRFQSGFINSGRQYVQVFDVQGGTLTGNNTIIYHKDAAGVMHLISGSDKTETELGPYAEGGGGFAGYGYLEIEDTQYLTYYVRDNYVSGDQDGRTDTHATVVDPRPADQVKLSEIITASIVDEKVGPLLQSVVFDQTDYNKNATVGDANFNGTLTVDVSTKADLFSVTDGTLAALNINDLNPKTEVVVLADKDYQGVVGTLKIAGTDVYQIDNRGDLGTNVSLLKDDTDGVDHWTGTVRLTGTAEDVYMPDLSVNEGGAASTIEFNQWTGTFKEGAQTSNGKIVLVGDGVTTPAAINFAATDPERTTTLKWTNSVTGKNARVDHTEDGNLDLTMTGDTSGWTGTFNQTAEDTDVKLTFDLKDETAKDKIQYVDIVDGAGSMTTTYGGKLEHVEGDALVYGNGNLTLAYTAEELAVTSNITQYNGQGELHLVVGDGENESVTTFSGEFVGTAAADMTVEAGSTAVINTNAPLLWVRGEEGSSVVVNETKTLSLTSENPETGFSEFHGLTNNGSIQMEANGGSIHLVVDNGVTDPTYKVGDLDLVGDAGTAVIQTAANGQTVKVKITDLSGPNSANQVLQLKNSDTSGTVNYNLGGDTHFTGTIEFGSNGSAGNTNVVLDSNGVAANAVLKSIGTSEGTADVVVNTTNASVQGIDSAADATVGGTLYGEPEEGSSDNRKVTITGNDTYSYNGGLGENLDIAYTGDGKQTFEGGADNFNGAVTVDNDDTTTTTQGVLEILNASEVNVTDLLLGENDLLRVQNGGANGSTVVSASVVAEGGPTSNNEQSNASKYQGNLTLNSGASYDVSAAGGLGGLDLAGSFTINEGASLSAGDIELIYQMEIGEKYDLAFNVTLFNGKDTESGLNPDGTMFGEPIDANTLFGNQFWKGEYYVCYSGVDQNGGKGNNVGTVYLYRATPEPTTGTLSLLALAALAARRRRK